MWHGLGRRADFARGASVEIRSEAEVRATLDANGCLDGLPFMPEMAPFCGRTLRIFRRAEKVFLDRQGYVARLTRTVLLEDARCSGQVHGGCQMGCLMFWKEAWLKPASTGEPLASAGGCECQRVGQPTPCAARTQFTCQATELIRAGAPLPWWDLRQYVRDFAAREIGPGQFARMLWRLAHNKTRRACGLVEAGVSGRQEGAARASLGLQPGEWVEVLSREEIQSTLDPQGRTQGLAFGPEMLAFCGKRLRVARRVERLVVEWSGELRPIRNTVTLDGASCDGLIHRFCPRDCDYLWREAWLKRVADDATTGIRTRGECGSLQSLPTGESHTLRVVTLASVAELRQSAADWDDLWWRSDVTLPPARAELLALWIEHFAPRSRFRALVVEAEGRWVAAFPLVDSLRAGWLGAGGLPTNDWCPGGDLLLDPQCDTAAAMAALVGALRELPWPWLWLDVTLDAPRWQQFATAVDLAGMTCDDCPDWHVPVIPIAHDWEACQEGWSKKHLAKMRKAERHLAERGRVEFCDYSQAPSEELGSWIDLAFKIEDLGWKGAAGTSVVRTPGMAEFFTRQARQLTEWGQLNLAFLEVDGRPISFVYGFRGKGVCYWHKIGYDPEFRCSSPGQLLQYQLLKRLHADPDCLAVDCVGPLTDALAKWRPGVRTVGRLAVAPGAWRGRLALHARRHWWPRLRRWLGRPAPAAGRGVLIDSEMGAGILTPAGPGARLVAARGGPASVRPASGLGD